MRPQIRLQRLIAFPRGRTPSSPNTTGPAGWSTSRSLHSTSPIHNQPIAQPQPSPSPSPSPSSTPLGPSTTSHPLLNTINQSEIAHFSRLSSQWWDEKGEFGLLHRMNGPRMEFVRQKIQKGKSDDVGWSYKNREEVDAVMKDRGGRWLEGMDVVDVGCGGGLLTESLARVGANVIGVDASPSNIAIASLHASQDPRLPFIPTPIPSPSDPTTLATDPSQSSPSIPALRYRAVPAETLLKENQTYDLVCSMEVIEHVDSPGEFLRCLGSMVRPGGHLILSTINRTALSQFLTITMAEHVLRLVTPGTHTYSKYIKPAEVLSFVKDQMGGSDVWDSDGHGLEVGEIRGIVYNPLVGEWKLWEEGRRGGDLCNYMFHMRKKRV